MKLHRQKFPTIKKAWQRLFPEMMRRYLRTATPVAGQVPGIPMFEGSRFGIVKDQADRLDELQQASATVLIDKRTCRETDLHTLKIKLREWADEMAGSIERGFFISLSQQLEEAGQTYSQHGQPFSFETFLQTLEKVDWQFDPLGRWIPTTMILGPELYPHVVKVMSEASTDPDKIRRFKELEARKKGEFNVREAARKLVD